MASIPPMTDGVLKLTIENPATGEIPTIASSALGKVLDPRGNVVAENVPFAYHTGSRTWDTPIHASWSNTVKQGEFMIRLVFISNGKKLTDNVRYNVQFTDKT